MSDIKIERDWTAAEWPSLAGEEVVAGDTETEGLAAHDKAVSCGVATRNRLYWWAWGHLEGNNCSMAEFREWAERELNRPDLLVVFHNAQFDVEKLRTAGFSLKLSNIADTGILAPLVDERVPSFSLDGLAETYLTGRRKLDDEELNQYCAERFGGRPTMKAQVKNYWRAPGHMVAPYCVTDAELTLLLYDRLLPMIDEKDEDGFTLRKVYDIETALIPILIKMYRTGFRVDVQRAYVLQREIDGILTEMRGRWDAMTGGVNPKSSKQMAAYLASEGITVPTTAKGNPSVSRDFLGSLDHPAADLVRDIRMLEHFSGTFVRNYILDNVDQEGLVHAQFHQLKKEDQRGGSTGTVSGRFSSSGGLNLQNMPAPDPDSSNQLKHRLSERVRGIFVPMRPDQRILSADYSQIEFRIIAHYGGGQLRAEYNRDASVDFHDMVAALTGIPRKPAKTINFGLAYGMGAPLMAARLGLTVDEARVLLRKYHERLPEVREIYDKAMRRAASRGFIRTLADRKRRFYEDPEHRFGRYAKTHKALNALAQGGGADIMKKAMTLLAELQDDPDFDLHATVHDEIVASVAQGRRGDEIIMEVKGLMESAHLGMTVPIIAECKTGPDWGRVSKWNVRDSELPGAQVPVVDLELTLDDLEV